MPNFYELIGRIVIGFVRVRFRTQLRVGAAVFAAAALLISYLLSSREVDEG